MSESEGILRGLPDVSPATMFPFFVFGGRFWVGSVCVLFLFCCLFGVLLFCFPVAT